MKLIEVTGLPPALIQEGSNKYWEGSKMAESGHQETVWTTVPKPRKLYTTILNVLKLTGFPVNVEINSRWFKNDENAEQLVADLIANGMSNAFINSWEVPDQYVEIETNKGYSQTEPSGNNVGIQAISSKTFPVEYYFTPTFRLYNNKAKYCQAATIVVFNPCSGASMTKQVYDLLPYTASPNEEGWNLQGVAGANIRPGGCPVFCWRYNNGGTDQTDCPVEYIRGGTWIQITTPGYGLNGSVFEQLAIKQQREQLNLSTGIGLALGAGQLAIGGAAVGALGLTGPIASAGTGIINNVVGPYGNYAGAAGSYMQAGAGGIIGTLSNYIQSDLKLKQQQEMLDRRGMAAVTNLSIGNSEFFKDTGNNRFYFCVTRYDDNDLHDYDAFLTKYGYNVGNMRFTTPFLFNRKYFTFIRVNDAHIESERAGLEIRDKVVQELKAGIRIWRCKPDPVKMEPDGGNYEMNPDLPVPNPEWKPYKEEIK